MRASRVLYIFYCRIPRRVPPFFSSRLFLRRLLRLVSRVSYRVPPSCLFFFSMQGCSNFEIDEFDEDPGDSALGLSPEAFSPRRRRGFEENSENSGDYTDFPPLRQQLRSRPPIDFPLHHSTFKQPSSQMSGSTLYSRSNHFTFPPKAPLSVDPYPRLPVEVIASLTESELYYNPHYRELRQDHDYLSKVLAKYLGRDLGGPHIAPSTTLVPDIRQST
jgi:hypothetical protein